MFNYYKDNFLTQSPAISFKYDSNEEIRPIPTKLYVSNFPQNCTRRQLTEFFSQYGQVLECAIMWDTYAFIHYPSQKEAKHALREASNRLFMGNKLFIQLSTSKNRQDANWYQREVEKLQNQLFSINLQSDQQKFNDKESSLSASNSTISSLSSASSSSSASLLSNSILNINETKLFVTNLPDNCNQFELKKLFQNYGNVLECAIMWNHYAFIHYPSLNEAKNAVLNLHGYQFYGKTLIVQFSTTSNRPLPKCKIFNSNKTNSKINEIAEMYNQTSPKLPSILCYRASDLEKQLLNRETTNHRTFNKSFNNIDLEISLSDVPTPDTPDITNKIPPIPDSKKLEIKNDENFLKLEQIPTPPTPHDEKIKAENKNYENLKNIFNFNSDVDTESKKLTSLSLDAIKKISRSRCILINTILFPELKEKLFLK